MTSLSTRFLGQPRLTKPTLVGADFGVGFSMIGAEMSMEFIDFTIPEPRHRSPWRAVTSSYKRGSWTASSAESPKRAR